SEEHEAVLTSIEDRLCVRLRVHPDGRVVVRGHASDDLREGNTLVFAVRGLDRRCLFTLLEELREVEVELGIRAATSTRVDVRSLARKSHPGLRPACSHPSQASALPGSG